MSISFSTLQNPCSRKLYQFKLDGIDRDWSKWSESAEAKYTRLPVGEYKFYVRTLTSSGTITPTIALFFKVRPAWYASVAAMILYILIGIGGILASQYFYRKRLAKHHNRLHLIADEKRKAEKLNSEQEIMKLQNDKLQSEISHKNMQLADSTLSIIKKNEVLIEIKNELEKQKEDLGARYPARYLQRLTTLIDKNISNDNDWEMFEALFDQAHENFFKRLKQSFPDLTQSDLKLCAYLKLNLSSKEIAPLLNISIRGVEIRRYRLRKRLALSSDHNLVEYIMQF
jgi:DNA-binding CsgD family transcriptional regulator/cell division protein FtsB